MFSYLVLSFPFFLSVRSGGKERGGTKLESNDDALVFTCSSICGDAQIDGGRIVSPGDMELWLR